MRSGFWLVQLLLLVSSGNVQIYSRFSRSNNQVHLSSPLTANIYFPAIPTIASQFQKSVEMINLTVTIYMVMQGICSSPNPILCLSLSYINSFTAPMFWGTLSDRWGRRPMILACMIVLSLSCVGLALVPTSAYWLLMLLRCIQAAGSASTIALGEVSCMLWLVVHMPLLTPDIFRRGRHRRYSVAI